MVVCRMGGADRASPEEPAGEAGGLLLRDGRAGPASGASRRAASAPIGHDGAEVRHPEQLSQNCLTSLVTLRNVTQRNRDTSLAAAEHRGTDANAKRMSH